MLKIQSDTKIITGACHVTLSGKIGIPEAAQLQQFFLEQIQSGETWLVISLKNISFISSSGLGALLAGIGKCRQTGGDIIFIEITPKLRTILEYLDIMDYIKHAPQVTDAAKLIYELKPQETTPQTEQSQIELAVEMVKKGDIAHALPILDIAATKYPNNAQLLTWYGLALEKAGETEQAKIVYQKVMQISDVGSSSYNYVKSRFDEIAKSPLSDESLDKTLTDLQGKSGSVEETYEEEEDGFFVSERSISKAGDEFLLFLGPWYGGGTTPQGEPFSGQQGGSYMLIAGKGIAINPGKNYIEKLFDAGGRVSDLNIVILTHNEPNALATTHFLIKRIHRINSESTVIRPPQLFVNRDIYSMVHDWQRQYPNGVASISILEKDKTKNTDGLLIHPVFEDDNDYYSAIAIALGGGNNPIVYVREPLRRSIASLPEWIVPEKTLLLATIGNVFERKDEEIEHSTGLGFKETARLLNLLQPSLTICREISGLDDPLHFGKALADTASRKIIVPGDQWYIRVKDGLVKDNRNSFVPYETLQLFLNDKSEIIIK